MSEIVKVTTLPSGLRIITDVVPSVESVAIGVWVGVGTRNEDLQYNGVAHMVEHMLFKGTKTRNALDIAQSIENVGGHMNAYTSREITSYHIHLLKQELPLALDVLSDIIQNSVMPEDEVERERGVILQEIGMCHDTPDDIIFDHYFETAYPQQALGAPILGKNAIIENMNRDTLMQYVRTHYTPHNMVISISGNFDENALIAVAEEKFKDLPEGTASHRNAAAYKGGEIRQSRDLEQSHIVLGFKGVARTNDKYYAAQLLATMMGGGMSSRLFQEVREKRGLVYSIYSFHSSYTDDGQFGIYAGTGPDKLPELIPVVCNEINRAATTITQGELERAKAQLRASILMSRESMMSRADQHAKGILIRGEIRTPQRVIETINAVNIDMIQNIAKDIFASTPTLAALGPLGQLESYDSIKERIAA